MKFQILLITLLFFLSSCSHQKNQIEAPTLLSVHLIDRDGLSEAISNPDRLVNFDNVNFNEPQPYQKVLRIYSRNEKGEVPAYITTYHPNGQIKQYLEIINNRAFGVYQEWFPNGNLKVEGTIVEGTADISLAAEKTWVFDGIAKAYDECQNKIAEIPYSKGTLQGVAYYYHPGNALWKEIPYLNGLIEGELKIYKEDGDLLQITNYSQGLKNGPSLRFWAPSSIAANELYDNGYLKEGTYFSKSGASLASVSSGKGFKAIFGKNDLSELHEYNHGLLDGIVKIFDSKGRQLRYYHSKNNLKNGEEVLFVYNLNTKEMMPKLLINWMDGKIQGVTKSWYENGQLESQKEYSNNIKNGLTTAWYQDGQLMMIEHYDQGKLQKGDYFKKGSKEPISEVISGNGTVTLFDPKGTYLKKIKYKDGLPEE